MLIIALGVHTLENTHTHKRTHTTLRASGSLLDRDRGGESEDNAITILVLCHQQGKNI